MILNFNRIKKEDILMAGGKGANLGELISIGINVPNGFIITADVYREFLKENHIDERFNDQIFNSDNNVDKLVNIAFQLREAIRKGNFSRQIENLIRESYSNLGEDARVAVRSSATAEDLCDASFAGQQETYLNVRGMDDLLHHILNCYASMWGDRAVIYRFNKGYDQNSLSMAVVVQEMIESEKSGVLFTANPINKNRDEILINGSYGLGESVVSGRVTPDSYVVDRQKNILEVNIGTKETQVVYGDKDTVEVKVSDDMRSKRVLTDEEINGLIECALEIENHYGMPMDIEWAIKDKSIYILQARAITTLDEDKTDSERVEEYTKCVKLKKSVRDNLSFFLEKIPFAYRTLDFDFMNAINSQKANIFAEGGIILEDNPKMDNDGVQFLTEGKRHININIFNFLGILKSMKNFEYCYNYCSEFMDKYKSRLEAVKKTDFSNMNLNDCKEFMKESYSFTESLAYDRFKYALFPTMLMFNKYDKIIKKVDKHYSTFDFYWDLDNKTTLLNNAVLEMAEHMKRDGHIRKKILDGESFGELYTTSDDFRELADDFMRENGYKSDYNCYCLYAKTFIEDPNRLLNILRPMLNGDEDYNVYNKSRSFSELMASLKKIYGRKYNDIEKNIEYMRLFHVVREETQYMWETLFFFVRRCVKRINEIMIGDDDYNRGIANLFFDELIVAMERGSLNERDLENIKRRNDNFPFSQKVWEASKSLVFNSNKEILEGVSGSTGIATGKACIVHNPQEFYKLQRGDILVCELTDPEWTPLFKIAAAVVADTGAALSHAAIVAREFNIPAVLGVGFGTAKIKDGDMIQVDGNKGTVRIL